MSELNRETIFGRLIALATVLGDRVFDAKNKSVADLYLTDMGRKPATTIQRIHHSLIEHASKFGPEEMQLLDMFGEMVAALDIEDFTDAPLDGEYLLHFYRHRHSYNAQDIIGAAEFAKILGWSKQKLATYIGRGKLPEPIHRIAAGPLWYRKQAEEYVALIDNDKSE